MGRDEWVERDVVVVKRERSLRFVDGALNHELIYRCLGGYSAVAVGGSGRRW